MEKTFKEVAHLYLGCTIKGLSHGEWFLSPSILAREQNSEGEFLYSKPILHRLEDMTDKDAIELVSLWSDIFLNVEKKDVRYKKLNFEFNYASSRRVRTEQVDFCKLNSNQFLFLLSKHYDLFNLIDNGHAIDAKTL